MSTEAIQEVLEGVKNLTLDATESPLPATDTSEDAQDEKEADLIPNNIIFGSWKWMEYVDITTAFEISPPNNNRMFSRWMKRVLSILVDCDFENEVVSYEWMVLIHPSLRLLQDDPAWQDQVEEVLERFREHMKILSSTEGLLTLNDELICVELCGEDHTPTDVWDNINACLTDVLTFDALLDILLARKDKKKFQSYATKFESGQEIKISKSNASKYRDIWGICTNVITQLSRILRLSVENASKLDESVIANIRSTCDEFERRYYGGIIGILGRMVEMSDMVKMDYAFTRYKTLMIATHTHTTIPPTFAGVWGIASVEDATHVDWSSWDIAVDALSHNVDQFCSMVDTILGISDENAAPKKGTKRSKTKKARGSKTIGRLTAFETQSLRSLDNISYLSCCLYLGAESGAADETDERVVKMNDIRQRVEDKLVLCFENDLVLTNHEDLDCLMDGNLFMDKFLTYDKYDKQKWMLHLMAGILLNFWKRKR